MKRIVEKAEIKSLLSENQKIKTISQTFLDKISGDKSSEWDRLQLTASANRNSQETLLLKSKNPYPPFQNLKK